MSVISHVLRFAALAVCFSLTSFAMAQTATGELALRAQIDADVAGRFYNRDFDGLEAMADRFMTSDQRSPSGLWNISHFDGSLSEMLELEDPNSPQWSDDETTIERWIAKYPKSRTARLAQAHLL